MHRRNGINSRFRVYILRGTRNFSFFNGNLPKILLHFKHLMFLFLQFKMHVQAFDAIINTVN